MKVSIRILQALVSELEGDWRLSITMGGLAVVSLHWMEWTGMGSEPEHEIVFRGEPSDAFDWLCKRVNGDEHE